MVLNKVIIQGSVLKEKNEHIYSEISEGEILKDSKHIINPHEYRVPSYSRWEYAQ